MFLWGFNMFEDVSINISSILDAVYCKRRWYLHNIENLSAENAFMTEGKIDHEKIDTPSVYIDNGIVTAPNMQVYSNKLSLYGFCDLVRFEPDMNGINVPYCDYKVEPVPVEYKHGTVRICNEYIAQVTAYAMCLEEMYNCRVSREEIYFTKAHDTLKVDITDKHRELVLDAVNYIKNYDLISVLPQYSRKCRGCAMFDICSPRENNIAAYMQNLWDNEER